MSGGDKICDNFLLLLDTPAAVTYSQSLLMKGPSRVGKLLRGAVANHYLVVRPAASFCVAHVTFASSLYIDSI